MQNRVLILVFGVALLATGLSLACSSGGEEDKIVIDVSAQNTRFVPELIEVPAGQTVTLRLRNLDDMEHDLEIRGLVPVSVEGGGHDGHGGPAASTENVAVHTAARKTASVDFRADGKGTYEVFCSQPGHEQLGMVARLVVV